jgi:hypothetical protein
MMAVFHTNKFYKTVGKLKVMTSVLTVLRVFRFIFHNQFSYCCVQSNSVSTMLWCVYVTYVENWQLLLYSFPISSFSYSNCISNFPTKCKYTIEYLDCLLNICYMFRHSLCHPQEELNITSQKPSDYCKVVTILIMKPNEMH